MNVTQKVEPGQVWVFFDADREGKVKWLVESFVEVEESSANTRTDDRQVRIQKLTGRDAGYTTNYPVETMEAGRPWAFEGEGDVEYLWPCPECEKDRPIMRGDYVCIDCRALTDDSDPGKVGNHEGNR
jgi:hypothetical protein